MATAAKPTNERIADMLAEVLRELDEVKKTQNELAADLRSAARQTVKP